jgi:hypothetical protein
MVKMAETFNRRRVSYRFDTKFRTAHKSFEALKGRYLMS